MNMTLFLSMLMFTLTGCSSYAPIRSEKSVDLKRFMGDWYVIANIPTFIEAGAHNAIESYKLNPDGSIATTFSFNKDSFDGKKKKYHPTGYVTDNKSNAIWDMQFLWPFKSDYRIVYVSADYSMTIIGRIKRDYVWIMARQPAISDKDYKYLIDIIEHEGYDIKDVQKVPQRW